MPAIIDSGASYIANVNAGELAIADFVLAYIDGLDHTQPVDREERLPDAGDIVHTASVTQSGYLAPDKIVYSLAMDTGVGDFTFNWLGLRADNGTLVAVAYLPDTVKTATAGGVQGNNITRNFLLQFTDAQLATGITVPAETWQVDLSAYLNAMDARERQSNRDIYGRGAFFEGGWELLNNAGAYELQPGVGYVGGVRVVCTAPIEVDTGTLPTAVSLDVALQKTLDRVVAEVTPVRGTPADYTDGTGAQHVVVKIADIDTAGAVTDRRLVLDAPEGLARYVQDRIAEKAPLDSPALTGTPTAPTRPAGDSSARLATTAFVHAVVNALIDTAPGALDTLNELAEALNNDPDFATTITNALATKAPLESPRFTGVPRADTVAQNSNSTALATTEFVTRAISNLVNAAPGALDTLDELAAALGDDPNFAATIVNELAGKAGVNHTHSAGDIVSGVLPVSRGGTGVQSLSALAQQLEEYLMRQDWSEMGRGGVTRAAPGAGKKHIITGVVVSQPQAASTRVNVYDGESGSRIGVLEGYTSGEGTIVMTGLAIACTENNSITVVTTYTGSEVTLMGYTTTA